jgi:hypothetical protein
MTDSDLAHYLYAVGEAPSHAGLRDVSGIDGAPVACVVVGQLCGLTSTVSVPALRTAEHAQDVSESGWLAGAVRAHERVALHALEHAQILPMRFGTVFARPEDVYALLERHQAQLLAELRRLAGSTEWCLTVRVVDDAPVAPDGQQAAQPAEPVSGTAWLQSRQATLRARESHADRLVEQLHRVQAAVTPLVRDLVTSRSAGDADTWRLWLLVDDAQRLTAALDDMCGRHDGVTVQLTGPWPAYHFVRTDALHDVPATSDASPLSHAAEVRR